MVPYPILPLLLFAPSHTHHPFLSFRSTLSQSSVAASVAGSLASHDAAAIDRVCTVRSLIRLLQDRGVAIVPGRMQGSGEEDGGGPPPRPVVLSTDDVMATITDTLYTPASNQASSRAGTPNYAELEAARGANGAGGVVVLSLAEQVR